MQIKKINTVYIVLEDEFIFVFGVVKDCTVRNTSGLFGRSVGNIYSMCENLLPLIKINSEKQ